MILIVFLGFYSFFSVLFSVLLLVFNAFITLFPSLTEIGFIFQLPTFTACLFVSHIYIYIIL